LLVEIFGLIAIEGVTVRRHDLAGKRNQKRAVFLLEHPAFDLAAAPIFLDEDLAVMSEGLGDRGREFLFRPCLADADRGAEARRFHEDGAAELRNYRVEGRRLAEREALEPRDRKAALAHQALRRILIHG